MAKTTYICNNFFYYNNLRIIFLNYRTTEKSPRTLILPRGVTLTGRVYVVAKLNILLHTSTQIYHDRITYLTYLIITLFYLIIKLSLVFYIFIQLMFQPNIFMT